jgi:hypothetical protein
MESKNISVLSVEQFLDRLSETLRLGNSQTPFTMIVGGGFSHGVIQSSTGPFLDVLCSAARSTLTQTVVAREMIPLIPEWFYREAQSSQDRTEFTRQFWGSLATNTFTLTDVGLPSIGSGDDVSAVYSAAMLHGLPTPYLRRKFFRDPCAKTEHRINLAHLYVSSILHAQDTVAWREKRYSRFCSTVFTTNFDALLQIGLQLVSKLYYMTDRRMVRSSI